MMLRQLLVSYRGFVILEDLEMDRSMEQMVLSSPKVSLMTAQPETGGILYHMGAQLLSLCENRQLGELASNHNCVGTMTIREISGPWLKIPEMLHSQSTKPSPTLNLEGRATKDPPDSFMLDCPQECAGRAGITEQATWPR